MSNLKGRKSKTNYLSQILVIALMLFVLGLFANIIYHSYVLSNTLKSMQYLRIELKNDANIAEITTNLSKNKIIKKVEFISKDKGLELLKSITNTDPTAMLDENPLPNIMNAYLQPTATPLDIEKEVYDMNLIEGIAGIDYKKSDSKLLDSFITKSTWVLLILISVLLVISVFIIDSTVRLAIFSRRLSIRSMQLIGATNGFIRKPYLLRALLNGFISGLIAVFFIALIYASIEYYYPTLNLLKDIIQLSIIAVTIILIGILFTFISTFFSLRKYLRMKLDDLY
jgi:cell division transport system permease protein